MLAKLSRIARQLATIESVDEAVDLRNKAKAVETYAKAVNDSKEVERIAIVIRLRCERRIGELLPKVAKPGRKRSHDATVKLGELGISKSASSRYQTVAKLPEKDFERFLETTTLTRDLSTNSIIKLVREKERQAQRHGPCRGQNVITGDIGKLRDHLAPQSINLILTDPPYDDLNCYTRLADVAADLLAPGGMCATYMSTMKLPQVMDIMTRQLQYFWTFAIRYTGNRAGKVFNRRIQQRWKPVAVFTKPPVEGREWMRDVIDTSDTEKTYHEWEQSVEVPLYLIDKLTSPGELVVDPFVGSGTTLLAAKQLNRCFLGCELDAGTARMARRRLAA